jgi:hypothetical protein
MLERGERKIRRVLTMDEVIDEILKRVLDEHHLANVRSKEEVYVISSRELGELIREIARVDVKINRNVLKPFEDGLKKRRYRIIMKKRNNRYVKYYIARDDS